MKPLKIARRRSILLAAFLLALAVVGYLYVSSEPQNQLDQIGANPSLSDEEAIFKVAELVWESSPPPKLERSRYGSYTVEVTYRYDGRFEGKRIRDHELLEENLQWLMARKYLAMFHALKGRKLAWVTVDVRMNLLNQLENEIEEVSVFKHTLSAKAAGIKGWDSGPASNYLLRSLFRQGRPESVRLRGVIIPESGSRHYLNRYKRTD